MVGAAGFELATLCSQSRCATRLRYAPTTDILTLKIPVLGLGSQKSQLPRVIGMPMSPGKASCLANSNLAKELR